jgi:hypothetical protein
MAKKYITDKISAKTASSGITYEGDAVFRGGPDGTFSFDFNSNTTNEFSINLSGDDFLTVNGGTGVFEVGDIAGLFDGLYLKVDGSNNLLSWKASQDTLVTFGENSTVSLYGTGTNNASGAELHIIKGQSNEVTGKLKLNSTNGYLDLEYVDPGATNSFRLYQDYGYISSPLRIGANAAANELDDYEEGVYTPTFYLGSGTTGYGSGNFTVFTNNSKYVKVGRMVTLYLSLEYNGVPSAITTSSQSIGLGNLPFSLSIGSQIGGTYQFGYLKNNVPSTYGYNSTFAASYVSTTTFARKILFTKLQYNGGISLYTNSGMTGSQFPTVGPFGTNNYLGGIITYYTND